MLRLTTMFGALLLITACGEVKIDGSDQEAIESSMVEVRATLPASKQETFDKSVEAILFDGVGNIFEAAANPEGIQSKFRERVDGMTAQDILTEGEKILAEREARRLEKVAKEREQAVGELAELDLKIEALLGEKAKTENDAKDLKGVKVLRSRFFYRENSYSQDPIIEVTVKNETTHPISRIYFHGTLATAGRSIPWVKEDFNYSVSGGLEPNEEATWSLAPNAFGEWGKAPKDRNDMILTVEVLRIDGADDEAVLNSEFPKYKQDQLITLQERKAKLEELING